METIKKYYCLGSLVFDPESCGACPRVRVKDTGIYSWGTMAAHRGTTVDEIKTFLKEVYGITGTPEGIHKATYEAIYQGRPSEYTELPGGNGYGLKLVGEEDGIRVVDSEGYILAMFNKDKPLSLPGSVGSRMFPKDGDARILTDVPVTLPSVKLAMNTGETLELELEDTHGKIRLKAKGVDHALLWIKKDGYIYLNKPRNSVIHKFPGIQFDNNGYPKVLAGGELLNGRKPEVASMVTKSGHTVQLVAKFNSSLGGIELKHPEARDCILWVRPDGRIHINNPKGSDKEFYRGITFNDLGFAEEVLWEEARKKLEVANGINRAVKDNLLAQVHKIVV